MRFNLRRGAAPLVYMATAIFSGLWANSALADTIMLNNGDRISGTVDNITSGQLTVTTAYAGPIIIAMASVTDIQTDGTYDLTLNSGDQVSGQLVNNGVSVNGSVVPTQLADISLLATPPSTDPVWTSRIDALATLSNGNAKTQTLSLIGDSMYTHGNNEHRVTAYWGDEEADGETTKNQLEIDYGYRRYLRDNWYALGNIEYFKDTLKDVDSRWTVGVGVGKLWWNNALGRLSTELGVSQVFEKLNGDSESNPALRWALDYNRFLSASTEFYHNHEILKILGGGRGEIFDSSTGLRYLLSDQLSLSLRADLRHETSPPPGAHKSDITYGIGVGQRVSFEQKKRDHGENLVPFFVAGGYPVSRSVRRG